jgi:hypothetical protein
MNYCEYDPWFVVGFLRFPMWFDVNVVNFSIEF